MLILHVIWDHDLVNKDSRIWKTVSMGCTSMHNLPTTDDLPLYAKDSYCGSSSLTYYAEGI